MALGKNLPQSAQSDSFYYLLITLLLQAGEFSNLLRPAGRRAEEEVVFPALRDKRPSQVSENVLQFCTLTRLYHLLLYLYIKWRNRGVYIYKLSFTVYYTFIFKLYESILGYGFPFSFILNTSHSLHKLVNLLFIVTAYTFKE